MGLANPGADPGCVSSGTSPTLSGPHELTYSMGPEEVGQHQKRFEKDIYLEKGQDSVGEQDDSVLSDFQVSVKCANSI